MKIFSREFTLKEQILILVLVLLLLGLAYYQFVDQPVRASVANANAKADELTVELQTVEAKLERMRRMRSEVDSITAGGTNSEMGSYNNSKAEVAFLNDVLSSAKQYNINFSNVTRNEDQIRRNFTLQFTTATYDEAEALLNKLSASHYRCLIGDLRCTSSRNNSNVLSENTDITVNATATFYETMVGGTPDAGLPASERATT